MRKPRLSGCGLLHGCVSVSPVLLFFLLLASSWRAAAQAQQAPQTDPVEGICLARQSSVSDGRSCVDERIGLALDSGGGERDPEQAGAEREAIVEHQREPLQRRGDGRHIHRRQPGVQPGHQVRLLRPQQHALPCHQAVSPCPSSLQSCCLRMSMLPLLLYLSLQNKDRFIRLLFPPLMLVMQEDKHAGRGWPHTRGAAEPHSPR